MYYDIYNLINNVVFQGTVVADTYPDLVCTVVASIAVLALIAIPFVIVWKIIGIFTRW